MYKSLISLIRESKHCVVFTGAGVSTLSGIRDFRGKDGVYSQAWQGYRVEDILSLPFFERDPKIFYSWAKEFCYCLDRFEASLVHRVLGKFEHLGIIEGVYTQNIDLLHQKGGSQHVWEIHGSPAHHHCLSCRAHYGYEEIADQVMRDIVPHCDKCGGVVKPDIIFYGEGLDTQLLERAFKDMESADLCLVLGSSLTVQPAASLPLATYQAGGKVVIVNEQSTPLDFIAVQRYPDLEKVFKELDESFVE